MGQSTNGILAYGWDLGSVEDEDEGHWAWPLLRRLIYDVPEYGEYEDVLDQAYDLRTLGLPYARKLELRMKVPVEFVHHCSCDYAMLLLALKSANWTAYRGTPVEIGWEAFYLRQPELEMTLHEAARRLKIMPPEPPRLLLASHWC